MQNVHQIYLSLQYLHGNQGCIGKVLLAQSGTKNKPVQMANNAKTNPTKWTFWQRSLQQSLVSGHAAVTFNTHGMVGMIKHGHPRMVLLKTRWSAVPPHWPRLAPTHTNTKKNGTKQFCRASYQPPDPPAPAYLTVASTILHGNQYTLTRVREIAAKTSRGSANCQESIQESDTGKMWKNAHSNKTVAQWHGSLKGKPWKIAFKAQW